MTLGSFEDYDAAIRAFWAGRDLQTQKQIDSGKRDAGTRGSVTGGKHLEPLQEVIADQFAPLEQIGAVVRHSGVIPLPGYYRRAKNWDIIVTLDEMLVAAIECKSQVGSFGRNFNNRNEEAIGTAADFWRAYEQGYIGSIRPWVGFVFVAERSAESTNPNANVSKPTYPIDPAFTDTSFTDRYGILFRRLVHERLYDAACLISTEPGQGIHSEPVLELSTQNLTAAIAARVAYIQGLVP